MVALYRSTIVRMKGARYYPPAYYRYIQNNPTTTIRWKKEEKEKIVSWAKERGLSISAFLKDVLFRNYEKFRQMEASYKSEIDSLKSKISSLENTINELVKERDRLLHELKNMEKYRKLYFNCPKCGKEIYADLLDERDRRILIDALSKPVRVKAVCSSCAKKKGPH